MDSGQYAGASFAPNPPHGQGPDDLPPDRQDTDPGRAVGRYAPQPETGAEITVDHDAWTAGTIGLPPAGPPYYGGPVWTNRPDRRRRNWTYAAVALGLVAALGVGIGIGGAVLGGRSSAPSAGVTIGARSAPTVAVASGVQDLQQSVINVVHAVQPSVVEITSQGRGGEAIGSGDILTQDGYIVTNDHVVQGFSRFTVTFSNGKSVAAQVVGEDPQDDLAVLKAAATNLQPIAFGDSSKAQVGEFAIAVGNPLGLQQTATFGIVSALNRTASEEPDGPAAVLTGLIQTSAPINPGNSGGALVDLQGALIGIPTLGETSQQSGASVSGIGFAIPSNRVKYVAQQLIQNGHLTSSGQGFLGIQGRDVTPDLAAADNLSVQQGVLIVGFAADAAGQSPAQQAGLQAGDVIAAVDGQPIADEGALAAALLNRAPGTQVSLSIVRGTSQHTVTVTLGERPAAAQG
jgi:S1-C subfamily serine protease